ncbi:head-tail adaptor protein [Sinorhizobium meliloti]|nr:head-tail adaptor protein [Sinorhizobium meliloti]
MPQKFGAGQMKDLVAFASREMLDDGYGNTVAGEFIERFREPAKFTHLRGSETVMAARLESRNAVLLQVWVSERTADVTADWQVTDVRRGTVFNIREIHQDRTLSIFEMLIESKVAT